MTAISIVLSHYQASHLIENQHNIGKIVSTSLNLGKSLSRATIESEGVIFQDRGFVSWEVIMMIFNSKNNCFIVKEGEPEKIIAFSDQTNRVYSLYPTSQAPTMLISGIPMHRIKDTTPDMDTQTKIKSIRPTHGRVLDTSTGLGYTAIQAAQTTRQVLTIELDPAVLDIARMNPWSYQLFTDANISQIIGDSSDLIHIFPDHYFDYVIHDPPVLSLAGSLYSEHFYLGLFRIINKGGKLFHYIGDPESHSGKRTTAGVTTRLTKAGFNQVQPNKKAFGVVAFKL